MIVPHSMNSDICLNNIIEDICRSILVLQFSLSEGEVRSLCPGEDGLKNPYAHHFHKSFATYNFLFITTTISLLYTSQSTSPYIFIITMEYQYTPFRPTMKEGEGTYAALRGALVDKIGPLFNIIVWHPIAKQKVRLD